MAEWMDIPGPYQVVFIDASGKMRNHPDREVAFALQLVAEKGRVAMEEFVRIAAHYPTIATRCARFLNCEPGMVRQYIEEGRLQSAPFLAIVSHLMDQSSEA